MAKALVIDPSHHAVQLSQREGFVCVTCRKCSCHHADRLEKECRGDNFAAQNHIGLLTGSLAPVGEVINKI